MGNFLEWQVTEGWEPLCTFLGRDVPQEDFPHGNGTDAFMQEMGRMFMDREARAKRNIAVTLGVFVAAVAVGVAGLMGGLR